MKEGKIESEEYEMWERRRVYDEGPARPPRINAVTRRPVTVYELGGLLGLHGNVSVALCSGPLRTFSVVCW